MDYAATQVGVFGFLLLALLVLALLIAWVLLPIFLWRQLVLLKAILYEQRRIAKALVGQEPLLPGQSPPR